MTEQPSCRVKVRRLNKPLQSEAVPLESGQFIDLPRSLCGVEKHRGCVIAWLAMAVWSTASTIYAVAVSALATTAVTVAVFVAAWAAP